MDIAKSIFGPKVPDGYAGREDYNVSILYWREIAN